MIACSPQDFAVLNCCKNAEKAVIHPKKMPTSVGLNQRCFLTVQKKFCLWYERNNNTFDAATMGLLAFQLTVNKVTLPYVRCHPDSSYPRQPPLPPTLSFAKFVECSKQHEIASQTEEKVPVTIFVFYCQVCMMKRLNANELSRKFLKVFLSFLIFSVNFRLYHFFFVRFYKIP